MVNPSGFECWFCDTDILLGGGALDFHGGRVNNALGQAGILQGALIGFSEVAHFVSGADLTTISEDLFVVAAYDGVDILHATIGNFDCISV